MLHYRSCRHPVESVLYKLTESPIKGSSGCKPVWSQTCETDRSINIPRTSTNDSSEQGHELVRGGQKAKNTTNNSPQMILENDECHWIKHPDKILFWVHAKYQVGNGCEATGWPRNSKRTATQSWPMVWRSSQVKRSNLNYWLGASELIFPITATADIRWQRRLK